jgi:hypothetical protein
MHTPCRRAAIVIVRASEITTGYSRDGVMYRSSAKASILTIGGMMEDVTGLLKASKEEIVESKRVLEGLKNDVDALYDAIAPSLLKQIKEIRASRMNVVSEVREALTAMRDLRKFFLEKDYEVEMARLERFVRLCKEIQALKQSGIFDAVCDSALHLAVGDGTSGKEQG